MIVKEIRKLVETKKLQPTFKGPALVDERLSDLNYKIRLDEKGHINVLHIDKLKKYKGDNFPTCIANVRLEKQTDSYLYILIIYIHHLFVMIVQHNPLAL
jgi:hypothetical protein